MAINDKGLFSLRMRGEKLTYEFRGFENLPFGSLCNILSDMTGYRADYLSNKRLDHMKIGERRDVKPAGLSGFDKSPTFEINRVG